MNNYEEKEYKVLDVSKEHLQKKMEEIGALLVFNKDRVITTLDTPEYSIHKQGKDLRLTEEEKIKLSCDVRNKDTSGNELGIKVFVSRSQETIDLLNLIGIQPVAKCVAHRLSYEWEGVDFDLDTFPNIPSFLEIDAGDSTKSLSEIIDLLELSTHKVVQMSTQEVFEYYNKNYLELFKV